MIRFFLTNNLTSQKTNFANQYRFDDFLLLYDNAVEFVETKKSVIIFCGILWDNQTLEQFEDKEFVPNGQFYCLMFDKQTKKIDIWSDFLEDFPVYYSNKDELQVTNSLVDFDNKNINLEWFQLAYKHNAYIDKLIDYNSNIPKLWNNSEFSADQWYQNITPLKGVKRLGPGRVITIDKNNSIEIRKYYDHISDYYNLIFQEPEYDFESATELTKQVLTQNIKTIQQKYSDLLLMCSNGVDSLVIASMMQCKITGYCGTSYNKENPQKLKNLFSFLPDSELYCFDENLYRRAYYDNINNWCTPSKNADLAPEKYIIEAESTPETVVIKGTFGDEIFWHEPAAAAAVAYHQHGCHEYDSMLEFLKSHYSYQPYHSDPNFFETIKSLDLKNSIMYYHYHRQSSYLKDDRILNNRMIVSPYIDMRLRSLMPLTEKTAQESSVLDAAIQKQLISSEYLLYLNSSKSGGEESFDMIDYKKIKKDQLIAFVSNIG